MWFQDAADAAGDVRGYNVIGLSLWELSIGGNEGSNHD